MQDGYKLFHLTAEAVQREFAPGMMVNAWGYNGLMPGPTIEALEGNRVQLLRFRRAKPTLTNSPYGTAAPSCTTRTPTRPCKWRWA